MKLPPTTLIFPSKQPDSWSQYDKKLALAWQIMRNETDPETGLPTWLAYSTADIEFKVHTRTNYAKRALDSWQDKQSKNKNQKSMNGVMPYVEASPLYDEELPSREDYYKSLEEE